MSLLEWVTVFALFIAVSSQGDTISVSTLSELRAAVRDAESGQVISLATERLELTSALTLTTRDVVLRGDVEGATLVCPDDSAALFISSPDVRVVDLRFEGCRREPAVVIEGRGQRSVSAVLRGVTFENNQLPRSNGSYLLGQPNPATAPLLIRRCRLNPCRTNMTVTVEEASFLNNSADQGGAIFATDAELTIRDTVFRRNSARMNGGAIFVAGIRSIVEIIACTFEQNRVTQSGSQRRISGASNGQPLEIVTYWSFAQPSATGGAVDIDSVTSVSFQDSNFISNLAPAGGAVAVTLDRNPIPIEDRPARYLAQFNGCLFEANDANYTEQLYARSNALTTAYQNGGAVYVISNAPEFRLSIEESTFLRNAARFGGALHVVTNMETAPRILQSVFHENSATESGGAMLMRNTGRVEFRASNCTSNRALLGGCMLMTNNARLQVEGPAGLPPNRQGISCYFMDNSAFNGGAVMCASCGDAVLREPYFINNTAVRNGGAVYVLETDQPFSIEQNIFQSNRAFTGGAVAVQSAGDVRVRGNVGLICRFVDNVAVSGGALSARATSPRENRFQVANSVFESNSAVSVEEALQDDTFRTAVETLLPDHSANSRPVNATAVLSTWRAACGVAAGGAICLGLRAVPNGAVAEYHILDTLIEQNRAALGGGVFVAVEEDGQWNQAEREGGACPATRLYDPCRSFRFVNVTVTENSASAGAGGIFITEPEALALQCRLQNSDSQSLMTAMEDGIVDDTDDICNLFADNSVDEGGFGANGGTDVHQLRIPQESRIIANLTSGTRLLPECSDCADNRTSGIQVEVLDAFGEVITGGISGADLAVNLVSNSILGERRYTAQRGIVNVNNTLGMGVGITESLIRVEAVRNPSLRAEIEFSTRSCLPGEEESFLTCEECRPLEYAFDPAPPGCIQCEDHAVCTGGAALIPVEGYWHSTPFSPQFHECIVKAACSYTNRVEILSVFYEDLSHVDTVLKELNETLLAGGNPTFPSYLQCARGYEGILCGSCEPGYGHFAGGECVECPTSKSGSALISVLISLWMTFFVGANIVTTFSSTHRQIRLAVYKRDVTVKQVEMQSSRLRDAPSSGIPEIEELPCPDGMDDRITAMIKLTEILKILVNYLQVTSVALTINLNWIGLIEGLLSVELMLIGVTSGSSYFVPLDCSFDEEDPEDQEGVPNSIKVLWLRATFPLILLVFFIVASSIYVLRTQRLVKDQGSAGVAQSFMTVKSYCIVVVIVVVFFSYISITSELMRTINCIKVDEESTGHQYDHYAIETGDRVWAEDTSLYCFKGDHTATGVFGVLGLVFFSLGVIVFILTWLPWNSARLDDPAFIAEYGFIYQGYREQWYTTPWEAAIAVRKALIATAVVYAFPLGPNLQGVCAMGVIILSIALQFIFSPFKPFKDHPNLPPYAGQLFRAFKLDSVADYWVSFNNRVSLNALEAASLLLSLIVFYAGILFNDENATTAGRYTMAVFTFVVNVGFIVYVLYRLYCGAHVAVNLYCAYLSSVQPSRTIPEGYGVLCLIRKALMIYRHREIFKNTNGAASQPDNRFEERI